MKKLVAVLTEDDYLFEKIRLASLDCAEVYRHSPSDALEKYDCIIADIDSDTAPDGAVTVSRDAECDMPIPFSFERLRELITGSRAGAMLRVSRDVREVYLRGRRIALTEVEHALLLKLAEAGDFVSRDELLFGVWGNGANSGVINVYIHYLREKLEADGEKIIISSRKYGYKIAEKYLMEDEIC